MCSTANTNIGTVKGDFHLILKQYTTKTPGYIYCLGGHTRQTVVLFVTHLIHSVYTPNSFKSSSVWKAWASGPPSIPYSPNALWTLLSFLCSNNKYKRRRTPWRMSVFLTMLITLFTFHLQEESWLGQTMAHLPPPPSCGWGALLYIYSLCMKQETLYCTRF